MTQDIAFTATFDGTEQRYVEVLPAGHEPGRQYDVLIALHGHGSDRWQFVNDNRDECRAARDVAAEHRMIYISPDYRAKTSWMGPAAEADMVQIIGLLRERHRVGRVFICGASMGGSACLTFAALHPELVDGVASMNGTANFIEYEEFPEGVAAIAESFGGSKKEIPLEYKRRSAEFFPERFTMPLAIAASGRDTLVPPGSVVRLANMVEKIGGRVLLIYREETGHTTSYDDARAVIEFVADSSKATT
ncbi:MAG TPA: alpha/beta fold hydrolase [Candidatus Latescibacteria bacterium]|nr:alpha/beta fold hydrolase [Candidatus Latescibacterota bacterium]